MSSERTDERETETYAEAARRLLKMLDARKARTIAVVPANSDCSPSQILAVMSANKRAEQGSLFDAELPETNALEEARRVRQSRDGK